MGISKERVTMKQYQLLSLFLFLSLYPSFIFSLSYSCGPPKCRPGFHTKNSRSKCVVCEPRVTAMCSTKEIVFHRCGCPMCAKAKGETCGGIAGMAGKCASFLTCDMDSPTHRKGSQEGVCVEKESKKREKSTLAKLFEFFRQLFG